MAKRRPRFDSLERRVCLTSGPTPLADVTLPTGNWTPTVYRASPIFVHNNATNTDEVLVVAGGAQIVAYAENPAGQVVEIGDYTAPSKADIKSTPIVITDPTTGQQDLFAGMGRNENPSVGGVIEDGRVFGWNLATGQLLPGFTNGVSTGSQPENGDTGIYGGLTSGDLQGNGMPDIIATSFSHEVTAITLQGTVLWQWDNDDSIVSGAVVADIGRDGTPEVIVGGDSSYNPTFNFQNGGWVTVLNDNGQLLWRKQIPGEVTWSSPTVADLLNNGELDIIIGTGDNFSSTLGGSAGTTATEEGDYIYAFDPNGNMLPGWPYHTTVANDTDPHEVLGSIAVADLTGDGKLDVVAIDRYGDLHVIQPNGTDLSGFAGGIPIDPEQPQSQIADDYASPTIADVTGAGVPDIIATAGAYINAFTPSGTMIPIGTTPTGTNGLPEGVDIAPAVGAFNSSGGLVMAVVTWDALQNNRPDRVVLYQLPPSTLTPPWPMLRRTATGDAVMRSPSYDQTYVTQAFTTLLGSQPSTATVDLYVGLLNNDQTNLLSTAQLIAISQPVQDAEINKLYEEYFGLPANSFVDSYFQTYLDSHSYRQMESFLASSAQFSQRAGGNEDQELIYIYEAILNRLPSIGEANGWVATGLPIGTITLDIANSAEAIEDQFNAIGSAMFPGANLSLLPADAEPTFSLDAHSGTFETQMTSLMLASAGNYAETNYAAGYIANLYRDILNRDGAPFEIGYFVSSVDNGSIPFTSLATVFLNSTEAREDYIRTEYELLLNAVPSSSTLAGLNAALPTREDVLIYLVGSPAFYAEYGNNLTNFVIAAYNILGSDLLTTAQAQGVIAGLQPGTTNSQIAAGIIYTGTPSLYFANLVVNQIQLYIPDGSQGVLRTGTNAQGQIINPSPKLIASYEALYDAGESDVQVISAMLNTTQYYLQASYYRGIYRSPFIRY